MKPINRHLALLILITFLLVLSFASSSNAQTDKDSIRAEIHLLIEQADSLSEEIQYDSAIIIGKQALEKAEAEFGKEDTIVALVLHQIGFDYYYKAEFVEAQLLLNRALKIRQKALGPEHPDVAKSLRYMGHINLVQGRYAEAESLYKQAISIWEKIPGPEDPEKASCLYALGKIYWAHNNYAEVESLFNRALETWEEVIGADSDDVLGVLTNLAFVYQELGRYAEAESLFIRALATAEKTYGSDHPFIADYMTDLLTLYKDQGRYAEAVPLCRQALAIMKNALDQEPPNIDGSMIGLTIVYRLLGEYAEVESIYQQALSIWENILGPEHRDITFCLYNLALLYHDQGKYDKAAPLYRRARAIWEKVLHPEAWEVAECVDYLAAVYHDQSKYADAERLYKRSLAIKEKVFSPENLDVAFSLDKLARVYHDQGRHAEAELLHKRALEIREKILGRGHSDLTITLDNLANLYHDQGKYDEAEKSLKRALAIREKTLVPEHPDVSENLNNLAILYSATGEIELGLKYYKKQQESRQNFIDYAFSYASEGLKMRYIQKYPLLDHSFFSFALLDKSTEARRPALEMALKSKAVIIDAVSAEKEIAYCSYDDELIAKAEKHAGVCDQIAALALAGAQELKPEIYKERLQTLYHIKDSLETELSRDCAEFKDELASRRFTVEDVANALPEGGILLEFVRYEPYDFKKIGSDKERTRPPRYLAFTLDHAGEIGLTDLGDAEEIDSLVTLARKMIYNAGVEISTVGDIIAETRLSKATGRLYDLIFAPLESSLGGKTQIFISPDGQLSLLPFEILSDSNGKYAIEKYNISYLSSGRDLLKFKKKPEYSNWALTMADPDFDLSHQNLAENSDKTLIKSEYMAFIYEPSRGASGCLNTRFDLLPYTKKETKSVVKTLKKKAKLDVDAYYGDKALEEVLKGMTISPRVLHLSTHGYFCEDVDITENKMLENPLLRSGLVFAGANRLEDEAAEDTSQREDGILTAFEVSGLNLTGTELVTLSACETGVGEVQNGEGVYGLRRAFQHAGARTILMSLWKVPDKETHDLMDNFYKNWLSGMKKQVALRQSALKVIEDRRKKHDAAHPYYWGAFVMLGDPE